MFVSTKGKQVGSTASVVTNSVLIISHITFRGCRVRISSDNLSRKFWPLSLCHATPEEGVQGRVIVSQCFDRINEISGGHEKGLVLEN